MDDALIPPLIIGGIGLTLYDNSDLILHWANDIARTAARNYRNGFGFQYALRASQDGMYPLMARPSPTPVGYQFLHKDDVWKYGETTDNERYRPNELRNIGAGVYLDPEFFGTVPEIKMMEKLKIYKYIFQHWTHPPGNKITR